MNFGEDGRASIITAKFSHLPLFSQHPQRIADFGFQSAFEIGSARTTFQPIPQCNRWKSPFGQRGADVGDGVFIIHWLARSEIDGRCC